MHPYESLGERYFWSSAVAKKNMFDINELWDPRFKITKQMKVATFGSCFAQHIGRALAARGFNWMIAETAPLGMSEENSKKFNFGVFSARTGNIYTATLLNQWIDWSLDPSKVPDEFWESDGRFYDPFRPNIEPDGFASREELVSSRLATLEAFRKTLTDSDVFVFTLGLTESWKNSVHGHEYPMCPGTAAGVFNEAEHVFENQDYPTIRKAVLSALKKIRDVNPKVRFLLTVSPVPLTATMSGHHVMVATMESKSILRAVAGAIVRQVDHADYFPSYEIINATPYRGSFFEPNQRSVNHAGVDHVMNNFFACLNAKFPLAEDATEENMTREARRELRRGAQASGGARKGPRQRTREEDVVCEEALLNAFAKAP